MNLCILNDGSITSIHPATGSSSALDLSVCSPSLVLDYEWSTHDDLYGSDHFPVVLTAIGNDEDPSLNRWSFGGAGWQFFFARHVSQRRPYCLSKILPVNLQVFSLKQLKNLYLKYMFPQTDSRRFHGLTNNVLNKPYNTVNKHNDMFLLNRLQRKCKTINVYVLDHDLLLKNKIKRLGKVLVQNN